MASPPLTTRSVHPDRADWRPGGPLARIVPEDTVGAALAGRRERAPDSVVTYVHDRSGVLTRLTAGELWDRACAAADDLQALGVGAGDTVALCADTGPDLVTALFAAMLAGAVPFVVEPPLNEARGAVWGERFRHMAAVASPRALVSGPEISPTVQSVCADLRVPVLEPPYGAAGGSPSTRRPAPVSADAPAYLQFTSGTTGDAKAVVITHRQLYANVAAIAGHVPYRQSDVMVGWLPLHHDMGLVGTVFSTFLHQIPVVLMPPLAFAFRPELWPQAISRFRGTLSPAPNFAFHLCAARAKDEGLAGLDLSSWRVAFNGAEAVSSATLDLWQRRMGPLGFAAEAMQPCYGMAEIGIAVTLSEPERLPRVLHISRSALAGTGTVVAAEPGAPDAQEVTAVGRPLPGYGVRVEDADGNELPERRQGRLIISGPSLTERYLTVDGAGDPSLRPDGLDIGDLGFYADGDLFVTGRVKDLIIIGGRNYLPYSLEAAAAEVPGIRRGGVAAVGVPHPERGTETLLVVAESAAAHDPDRSRAVAADVERVIAARTGLRPDRVHLLPRGKLPKTPSGKLQRVRITALAAAGLLDPV
ncbi:AMP-binding protein [Streptomyces atriruber]|uniref:AMP-binding protein n=1 Tax=Streptomyces atriruber TaxID=545121 RepID=UPI0006E3E36B|nr:AMP-binding protein [Streptomyces atriruber]